MLEIITVFSARLYGSHSHKKRKLVETLREAAEQLGKVLRAYKTELDLNNAQKTACAGHTGAARYAFNWGLACKLEA